MENHSSNQSRQAWWRFLEKRTLRTQFFFVLILPLMFVLIGIIIWTGILSNANFRDDARDRLAQNASHLSDNIDNSFQLIPGDLERIASGSIMQSYLETIVSFPAENIEEIPDSGSQRLILLRRMATGVQSIMNAQPAYERVRLVDINGNELMQVERNQRTGLVLVISQRQLQENLTEEDFFQQGLHLQQSGEYWVSEVRLARTENGEIIEPYRPVMQIVRPIFNQNNDLALLLAMDIRLDTIFAPVLNSIEVEESISYIVDSDGYYITHSADNADELLYGRDLNTGQLTGQSAARILENAPQKNIRFEWDGDDYIGATAILRPTEGYGTVFNAPEWRLVVAQDTGVAFAQANNRVREYALVTVFIVFALMVAMWVGPAALKRQLTDFFESFEKVTKGDIDVQLPEQELKEFNEMAQLFNVASSRLQNQITGLEQRLQDRIRDLELAAEISREVAGLRDLDLVMERTIGLIVERFGYYHAQVFLLDDVNEYAVLVASTGVPGQNLLAKKHRLAVGSNSVIGRVTELGVTVIAGDTSSSEVPWRPNEELPRTRSEMALPLKVENRVIGALDIQSIQPEDYSISDIEIFQVLADQLAIAINNARLINELEQRVDDIAKLNRRLTETAWESFAANQNQEINEKYQYDLQNVKVLSAEVEEDDPGTGSEKTPGYSVPIEIGGSKLGTVEVTPEAGRFSQEDQMVVNAVAGRISLAIENARLFEQTQSALAESRRLYDAARTISSAAELNIQGVYELIVDQLTSEEAIDQVAILTAQPLPSYHASYLMISHLWYSSSTNPGPDWQKHDRLTLLLDGLSEVYEVSARETISLNKEMLTPDILAYSQLRQIFQGLNTQSIFILPLVSGAKWYGLLICGSHSNRLFREGFRNFASALADQLAIAIENRRLLEEVQTEARRALALAEASKLASQISGDLQSSLDRLFRLVSGPGEFNRWWFGVLQSDGYVLQQVSSSKPIAPYNFPEAIDLRKDQNAITETVNLQHVLLINEFDQEHPVLGTIKKEERVLYGKHLALPVLSAGEQIAGALLIGRDETMPDLDEQDIQLATTLASQLAIALENQRLYAAAESQRQTLQSALETMPAGVLLLSPDGRVLLSNQQSIQLLGEGVQKRLFGDDTYPIYRAGINEPYAPEEFPTTLALRMKKTVTDENIFVTRPDGSRVNLLANAAPVMNETGEVSSVVAVFQEITEIRELEKALQSSLSETTALYEASRTISTSASAEDLTGAVQAQLHTLVPDYIFLIYQEGHDEDMETWPRLVSKWPEDISDDLEGLPFPARIIMPDEMLIFDDLNKVDITMPDPLLLAETAMAGISSLAALPMQIRGRILGWIAVGFKDQHTFIPEERRFLTTVADQATIVLNNARLFESTQRALRAVANLYRSSRRIAEAQGVNDAIDVMQEELLSNFEPDRIDLLLKETYEDEETLHFALTWARDPSFNYVPSLPVDADNALPRAGFDPMKVEDYIIQNLRGDTDNSDFTEAMLALDTPYQSFLSVPLRTGGRTVGRLGLAFIEARRFSPDDHQLITTLSAATAYIVENDLLFQKTRDSLEETSILYQASRAIANAESREEIVQAVIDYAASAPVDKVMLITLLNSVWEDPEAVIEIVATWGDEGAFELKGLRFTRDQFPLWEQLATPAIEAVDDVLNAPGLDENTLLGCQAMDIGAFLVVPLKTPNRPIGSILIASTGPRVHDDREIRIYQALADQAAVQLDNKGLYEQAEVRARQLETSAEVSRAAISILDLDLLFPRIVNLILESFHYDHVQIFMVDENNEHAVLRASTGEAGRNLLEVKHSLPVGSRSVIGQVTELGRPTIALDTADAENVHRPNPFLPDTRSEMAIPLIVKNRVVGALDVQSNQPRAFNDDDIQALTTLADQLAVAIENARLYQISQRRGSEMKFLFDVTSAAAAAENLYDALLTLAEVLIQQTGAHVALVFLYNTYARQFESQVIVESIGDTHRTEVVEEDLVFEPGKGVMGWMIKSHQPLVISDVRSDDRYIELFSYVRSGIYVPLLSGEELVGAIALESKRLNNFSEETLELLQTLGTTVAAVIRTTQLLEEVQRTNEQLREIDQLKTNFLAAMSHELRTPLNSIIGFSRVILKGIDGPINDMQEQDIQTIHDSGKHLLRLVNDILDQAKVEAGKMDLSLNYFDLTEVIKSSMSTAVGLTQDKPIQLYNEVADDMPLAYGDEFRTRQILGNLLSNAAKFTQEGGITVSAYPAKEDEQLMLYVSVTDTGEGIDEKDFPKLFESFQQVDNTTTRSAEGTGLGLPLSKSLAELQGGTLWVESTVGQGSTFYFSVPTEPVISPVFEEDKAETDEEQVTSVSGNGNSTEETGTSQTEAEAQPVAPRKVILAVDDELGMINLYRRYLKKEGWQVIGIHKPERVEEMVALHHPRMILLDVNMPTRNGWNVLESLKSNAETNEIPVVICSIDGDTEKSKNLGAAQHLVKPFVEEDLLKTVSRIDDTLS